jgi:hypothetical protein
VGRGGAHGCRPFPLRATSRHAGSHLSPGPRTPEPPPWGLASPRPPRPRDLASPAAPTRAALAMRAALRPPCQHSSQPARRSARMRRGGPRPGDPCFYSTGGVRQFLASVALTSGYVTLTSWFAGGGAESGLRPHRPPRRPGPAKPHNPASPHGPSAPSRTAAPPAAAARLGRVTRSLRAAHRQPHAATPHRPVRTSHAPPPPRRPPPQTAHRPDRAPPSRLNQPKRSSTPVTIVTHHAGKGERAFAVATLCRPPRPIRVTRASRWVRWVWRVRGGGKAGHAKRDDSAVR